MPAAIGTLYVSIIGARQLVGSVGAASFTASALYRVVTAAGAVIGGERRTTADAPGSTAVFTSGNESSFPVDEDVVKRGRLEIEVVDESQGWLTQMGFVSTPLGDIPESKPVELELPLGPPPRAARREVEESRGRVLGSAPAKSAGQAGNPSPAPGGPAPGASGRVAPRGSASGRRSSRRGTGSRRRRGRTGRGGVGRELDPLLPPDPPASIEHGQAREVELGVRVRVVSATNLPAKDLVHGLSDPYVVLSVHDRVSDAAAPPPGPAAPPPPPRASAPEFPPLGLGARLREEQRTRVVERSLSPLFEEEFTFALPRGPGANAGRHVRACVYDRDLFRDELLGEVTVALDGLREKPAFRSYPLRFPAGEEYAGREAQGSLELEVSLVDLTAVPKAQPLDVEQLVRRVEHLASALGDREAQLLRALAEGRELRAAVAGHREESAALAGRAQGAHEAAALAQRSLEAREKQNAELERRVAALLEQRERDGEELARVREKLRVTELELRATEERRARLEADLRDEKERFVRYQRLNGDLPIPEGSLFGPGGARGATVELRADLGSMLEKYAAERQSAARGALVASGPRAERVTQMCARHVEEPLLKACVECSRAVCGRCALSQLHRGHTFVPVEDAADDERRRLRRSLERAAGLQGLTRALIADAKGSVAHWEASYLQGSKALDDAFDLLIHALRERQLDLRAEAERSHLTTERELRDLLESLARRLRDADQILERAGELAASPNAAEVVDEGPRVHPLVDELGRLVKKTPWYDFVAAAPDVRDLLLRAGSITVKKTLRAVGGYELPDPSGKPRAPQLIHFKYTDASERSKGMRRLGVLYWLGTDRGKEAWRNPRARGSVAVEASSIGLCLTPAALDDVVGCQVGRFFTQDGWRPVESSSEQAGPWVTVDLQTVEVRATHYALSTTTSQTEDFPRRWQLQASRDGRHWKTLASHDPDERLRRRAQTYVWRLHPEPKEFYRYWRIILTGPNERGTLHLELSAFELYGYLRDAPWVGPAALGTRPGPDEGPKAPPMAPPRPLSAPLAQLPPPPPPPRPSPIPSCQPRPAPPSPPPPRRSAGRPRPRPTLRRIRRATGAAGLGSRPGRRARPPPAPGPPTYAFAQSAPPPPPHPVPCRQRRRRRPSSLGPNTPLDAGAGTGAGTGGAPAAPQPAPAQPPVMPAGQPLQPMPAQPGPMPAQQAPPGTQPLLPQPGPMPAQLIPAQPTPSQPPPPMPTQPQTAAQVTGPPPAHPLPAQPPAALPWAQPSPWAPGAAPAAPAPAPPAAPLVQPVARAPGASAPPAPAGSAAPFRPVRPTSAAPARGAPAAPAGAGAGRGRGGDSDEEIVEDASDEEPFSIRAARERL
eukprot:tig00001067_g6790.t1